MANEETLVLSLLVPFFLSPVSPSSLFQPMSILLLRLVVIVRWPAISSSLLAIRSLFVDHLIVMPDVGDWSSLIKGKHFSFF